MLLLWVVIAAVTVIVSILLSSVTVRRGCRQPLLALKAARPPLCLPLSGVGCLPKSFLGASSCAGHTCSIRAWDSTCWRSACNGQALRPHRLSRPPPSEPQCPLVRPEPSSP